MLYHGRPLRGCGLAEAVSTEYQALPVAPRQPPSVESHKTSKTKKIGVTKAYNIHVGANMYTPKSGLINLKCNS